MDGLQAIGAASGTGAYPPPPPALPGVTAATSTGSAGQPPPAPASSPEIDDAPSPTPEAILADTKKLPANVRYAPSAAPHEAGRLNFDRSA